MPYFMPPHPLAATAPYMPTIPPATAAGISGPGGPTFVLNPITMTRYGAMPVPAPIPMSMPAIGPQVPVMGQQYHPHLLPYGPNSQTPSFPAGMGLPQAHAHPYYHTAGIGMAGPVPYYHPRPCLSANTQGPAAATASDGNTDKSSTREESDSTNTSSSKQKAKSKTDDSAADKGSNNSKKQRDSAKSTTKSDDTARQSGPQLAPGPTQVRQNQHPHYLPPHPQVGAPAMACYPVAPPPRFGLGFGAGFNPGFGVGMPAAAQPMEGYLYSTRIAEINIAENMHLWDHNNHPADAPLRFRFQTWRVPCTSTLKEIMMKFGGGQNQTKAVTEVHESGNGRWIKGITVRWIDLDSDRMIQDMGWTDKRKAANRVWLCVYHV